VNNYKKAQEIGNRVEEKPEKACFLGKILVVNPE